MKTRTSTAGRALVADEELAQLKRQLEQWRAGRRLGQRIPVQLWQDAVRAAVEHGAYRVGRELNLDYAVLKRRASAAAGNESADESADAPGDAPASALAGPRFVELFAPPTATLPTQACHPPCVIELANTRGAKMRMELKRQRSGRPADAVQRIEDKSFKRTFSWRWRRDWVARPIGQGSEWGLCG